MTKQPHFSQERLTCFGQESLTMILISFFFYFLYFLKKIRLPIPIIPIVAIEATTNIVGKDPDCVSTPSVLISKQAMSG